MVSIFTIKNLKCGYSSGKSVLDVPSLSIPRGKLVFVIGASGGGKSTLLEALGLMNNTILNGSELHFHEDTKNTVDIEQLWGREGIDTFRKKHFSFIFQKTNLMPNFSCGENMVLPALFKGQVYDSVHEKVLTYMDMLDMRPEIFNDRVSNISGGQKQRLAFIRAMVADFTILFGDEPTGNLDPGTARSVMSVLKKHLIEHAKTGIVVSHDIGLASEFADMIIPITMQGEGETRKGVVNQANLLFSDEDGRWSDEKNEHPQIEHHLKNLIA